MYRPFIFFFFFFCLVPFSHFGPIISKPAPLSLHRRPPPPPSQLFFLLPLSSSSVLPFLHLLPPSLGCYISRPVTLTDLMRGWGCWWCRMLRTFPDLLRHSTFPTSLSLLPLLLYCLLPPFQSSYPLFHVCPICQTALTTVALLAKERCRVLYNVSKVSKHV